MEAVPRCEQVVVHVRSLLFDNEVGPGVRRAAVYAVPRRSHTSALRGRWEHEGRESESGLGGVSTLNSRIRPLLTLHTVLRQSQRVRGDIQVSPNLCCRRSRAPFGQPETPTFE